MLGRILILLAFILTAGAINGVYAQKVVPAEEILAKIENSTPIDYDNVTIVGNIDGYLTSLPRKPAHVVNMGFKWPLKRKMASINSSIQITNCSVYGVVNLSDSIFQQPVDFQKTIFMGDVSFRDSEFNEYADFSQSQFKGYAGFSGVQFNGYTTFLATKFEGIADFLDTQFIGETNFLSTKFKGLAVFMSSRFNGDLLFVGAEFNEFTDFMYSQFSETANFRSSKFNKSVDFRNCIFNKNTDFEGSLFMSDVLFSNSKINGDISFIDAKFNKSLWMDNTKFSTIYVSWDLIRDRIEYDASAYLLLINNFKNLGYYDEADNCYYQYRELKYKGTSLSVTKVSDWLAWILCGYGVRWYHTIASGVIVMSLFGIYFSWRDGIFDSTAKFKKSIELFFLSLIVFVSAPMELYRNAYTDERFQVMSKRHKYAIVIERLLGWSLLVLFIGVLSRLMIRY